MDLFHASSLDKVAGGPALNRLEHIRVIVVQGQHDDLRFGHLLFDFGQGIESGDSRELQV